MFYVLVKRLVSLVYKKHSTRDNNTSRNHMIKIEDVKMLIISSYTITVMPMDHTLMNFNF